MQRKILITGVAGFIGSNLAKRLLEQGHKVYGIDNLSYGSLSNISEYKDNPDFVFINGDVTDSNLLGDHSPDIVVHLASQKIPRYSNALRTLTENQQMLKNVVDLCIRTKSKLVFASTSDVYGKNTKMPFSEDADLVMGPTTIKRWSYALSKIYGEQFIIANNDENGLKYTITRFFGSYGPNQNLTWWGGPQSVFANKAFAKEPIEIHGDGQQTRTFTYIDDTIDGLLNCVLDRKAHNEIFNIGSKPEEEVTILELAELIWRIINGKNSEPDLKFIPYSDFGRYEDVRRRVPDLSKIKEYFGYCPKVKLEDGLRKTIEWQKKIMGI